MLILTKSITQCIMILNNFFNKYLEQIPTTPYDYKQQQQPSLITLGGINYMDCMAPSGSNGNNHSNSFLTLSASLGYQ